MSTHIQQVTKVPFLKIDNIIHFSNVAKIDIYFVIKWIDGCKSKDNVIEYMKPKEHLKDNQAIFRAVDLVVP